MLNLDTIFKKATLAKEEEEKKKQQELAAKGKTLAESRAKEERKNTLAVKETAKSLSNASSGYAAAKELSLNGQEENAAYLKNYVDQAAVDVESSLYNPYRVGATSSWVSQYSDTKGIGTEEWVERNNGVLSGAVYGDSGSVLKEGSTEEAYAYTQLLQDSETTASAKEELANLQSYINRKLDDPRNTAGDEALIAGINWDDYPTLKKIRGTLAQDGRGKLIPLTEAIDCTDDALYGMIFCHNNPEYAESYGGNMLYAAADYQRGKGNRTVVNETQLNRSTYLNQNGEINGDYNPGYSYTTLDASLITEYGASVEEGFPGKENTSFWNRVKEKSLNGDTAAKKLLKAEEYTETIEGELEKLKTNLAEAAATRGGELASYLNGGAMGDELREALFSGCESLERLYNVGTGSEAGDSSTYNFTRAVPFSVNEMRSLAKKAWVKENGTKGASEFLKQAHEAVGMYGNTAPAEEESSSGSGLVSWLFGTRGGYVSMYHGRTVLPAIEGVEDILASNGTSDVPTGKNSSGIDGEKLDEGLVNLELKNENVNPYSREYREAAQRVEEAKNSARYFKPSYTVPAKSVTGKAIENIISQRVSERSVQLADLSSANEHVEANSEDYIRLYTQLKQAQQEKEWLEAAEIGETAILGRAQVIYGNEYREITDHGVGAEQYAQENKIPLSMDGWKAFIGENVDAETSDKIAGEADTAMRGALENGKSYRKAVQAGIDVINGYAYDYDLAHAYPDETFVQFTMESSVAQAVTEAKAQEGLEQAQAELEAEKAAKVASAQKQVEELEKQLAEYDGYYELCEGAVGEDSRENLKWLADTYLEYDPKEFYGVHPLDEALAGGESRETVYAQAQEQITQYQQGLETMELDEAYLKKLPDSEYKQSMLYHLGLIRQRFENEIEDVGVIAETLNPENQERYEEALAEFAEGGDYVLSYDWCKAQGVSAAEKLTAENALNLYCEYLRNGDEDALSLADSYGNEIISGQNTAAAFVVNGVRSLARYGTESEKGRFIYLLETKGTEEALEYGEDVSESISVRLSEETTERAEEIAGKSPVLATLASIMMSPLKIADTMQGAADALAGRESNYSRRVISNVISALRGGVKQRIENENTGFVKTALSIVYDAIATAGDSIVNSILYSPFGGGVGAAMMGLGTYSDAAQAAASRGADPAQQALLGAATAFLETATEVIPMGKLGEALDSVTSTSELKTILKDSFFGDTLGEEINDITETLADNWIAGKSSQWNRDIEERIQAGETRQEAARSVAGEFVKDLGYTFAVSTLSSAAGPLGGYALTHTEELAGKAVQAGQERIALSVLQRSADSTGEARYNAVYHAAKTYTGGKYSDAYYQQIARYVESFGSGTPAMNLTRLLKMGGGETVKALHTASVLNYGKADFLFTRIAEGKELVTDGTEKRFEAAASEDLQDPASMERIINATVAQALLDETMEKLKTADTGSLEAAAETAKAAEQAAENARANAQKQQRAAQAAAEAVETIHTMTEESPTPENIAAETAALEDAARENNRLDRENQKAESAEREAEKAREAAEEERAELVNEAKAEVQEENADAEEYKAQVLEEARQREEAGAQMEEARNEPEESHGQESTNAEHSNSPAEGGEDQNGDNNRGEESNAPEAAEKAGNEGGQKSETQETETGTETETAKVSPAVVEAVEGALEGVKMAASEEAKAKSQPQQQKEDYGLEEAKTEYRKITDELISMNVIDEGSALILNENGSMGEKMVDNIRSVKSNYDKNLKAAEQELQNAQKERRWFNSNGFGDKTEDEIQAELDKEDGINRKAEAKKIVQLKQDVKELEGKLKRARSDAKKEEYRNKLEELDGQLNEAFNRLNRRDALFKRIRYVKNFFKENGQEAEVKHNISSYKAYIGKLKELETAAARIIKAQRIIFDDEKIKAKAEEFAPKPEAKKNVKAYRAKKASGEWNQTAIKVVEKMLNNGNKNFQNPYEAGGKQVITDGAKILELADRMELSKETLPMDGSNALPKIIDIFSDDKTMFMRNLELPSMDELRKLAKAGENTYLFEEYRDFAINIKQLLDMEKIFSDYGSVELRSSPSAPHPVYCFRNKEGDRGILLPVRLYSDKLINYDELLKRQKEIMEGAETGSTRDNLILPEEDEGLPEEYEEREDEGNSYQVYKLGNSGLDYLSGEADNGEVQSPLRIAKKMLKKLGVGDYLGGQHFKNVVPSGILGYYENRHGAISTRPGRAAEIRVAFHELGHKVFDANHGGIELTEDMKNLMPELAAALPEELTQNYPDEALEEEALAEFFWQWMSTEDGAESFISDKPEDVTKMQHFISDFIHQLGEKPDYFSAVMNGRNELRAYLESTAWRQVESRIVNSDKAGINGKKSFNDKLEAFLMRNVDFTIPFEKVDARNNTHIRRKLNHTGKSQQILSNALSGSGLYDIHGQRITGSLHDAIADTGFDGAEADSLSTYMIAQRGLERYDQWYEDAEGVTRRKTMFSREITPKKLQETIGQLEVQVPNIKEAAEAVRTWWRHAMQTYLVDTGFLGENGQQIMERWMGVIRDDGTIDYSSAENEFYVPTYRDMVRFNALNDSVAPGFRVMEARSSDLDIINPIDSMVNILGQLVSRALQNEAALEFEKAYKNNPDSGIGLYAQYLPINDKEVTENKEKVEQIAAKIQEALKGKDENGDIFLSIMEILSEEAEPDIADTGRVRGKNVLPITHRDGSVSYYEFSDENMFKLLRGTSKTYAKGICRAIGKLTRNMTLLTTGSNALFGARNFLRDFQSSAAFGHWTSNYITGFGKWVSAVSEIVQRSEDYQTYQGMGGGGHTRYNVNDKISRGEMMGDIFGKDYKNRNWSSSVKNAGKHLWELVTLEKLNEIIEQSNRYAEFKYGKHDLSTGEGREEAFEAAQEATVDFSRAGNGQTAADLRAVVPFFNASLQASYRNWRLMKDAIAGKPEERKAALKTLTKNAVNTALTSALASALVLKFSGDDEKDELQSYISDGVWAGHFLLPNPAYPGSSKYPYIRIPIAQDPVTALVHALVTNGIWNGSSGDEAGDEMVISAASVADTILDNVLGFADGDNIFTPVLDALQGKNYYGGNIIPNRYKYMYNDESYMYSSDTYPLVQTIGAMMGASPNAVQYCLEQYSGWVGKYLLPTIGKLGEAGSGAAWELLKASVDKQFTTDPLVSTGVVNDFYETKSFISDVQAAVKEGKWVAGLKPSLTEEETQAAAAEAKTLGKKMSEYAEKISACYDCIDEIEENEELEQTEKNRLQREQRKEIAALAVEGNRACAEWYGKYVREEGLVEHILNNAVPFVKDAHLEYAVHQ